MDIAPHQRHDGFLGLNQATRGSGGADLAVLSQVAALGASRGRPGAG